MKACPVVPDDGSVPEAPLFAVQRTARGLRVGDGADAALESVESLIEEVPVALVVNGISHAVMLATPADLEDFALGFCLSEGILDHPGQLYGCEVFPEAAGMRVELEVASAAFARLKARRRSLAGRSGCGLCGIESLQAAARRPDPLPAVRAFSLSALQAALAQLGRHQPLRDATHAAHAAAWAGPDGQLHLVREDVGRHNALDKLIGALARAGHDPAAGFALVSSRASVEMVQKAASARIGLMLAMAAPTALAVDTAQDCGLTLAGHARAGRLTIYTHRQHITGL